MRAFFRSAAHRYRLVLPLALIVAVASLVPWPHFAQATQPDSLPPTPVIMKEASLAKQGVTLSWLAATAGQNPLAGYVIERSRNNATFQEVGWAEPSAAQYLDTDGRIGDAYRVRAHDTQKIFSVAPEAISVTLGGSTTQVLSQPVDVKPESALPQTIPGIFAVFQEAAKTGNDTQVQAALTRLQIITYKALNELPQSSPQAKKDIATQCAALLPGLETSTNLLPEALRIDGRVVLATCEAIQKVAV